MKRFFELKHKRALLKKFFVFFLVISTILAPSIANWLGLENSPFVKEASAQQVELLTTSGTWTAPANVYEVTVEAWGAGGGGGGPNNKSYSAGGGGGAYSSSTLSVTPSSNYSYTIGTGGAGGNNGTSGIAGGDTYWVNTSTVLAKGGSGAGADAGAGAGGSSTLGVGTTKYSGGNGGEPTASSGGGGGGGAGSTGAGGNASGATAGTGTADNGGNGGTGTGVTTTGNPGSIYGGGGGGTYRSGAPTSGGSGADGLIRITYTTAESITVGTTGSQTSSVEASTSDFHIGGAFTFVRSASSTSVTSITVSETGTISDANISGLILYYKQEATCSTSIPGDATQFNSTAGTFTSGSSTVTGSMSVGTSQICVYVEIDIGAASNGDTVEIEITDPSTEVTASAGNVTPATAVAITGTTTVAVNQAPSFSAFSNDGPTDPGASITFTATSTDPDGHNVKLVVCKTEGITGTECDGGAGDTLCTSSLVTSNPSCSYSIPVPTPDTSYNSYPYVFDSNDLASTDTAQGVLATYTVNNVAPTVSSVTINGGTAINLNAASTKTVEITGTVTDNNSCEDVSSALGYVYRSGVGYAEQTNTTSTYYFDGNKGITDPGLSWSNYLNAFDGETATTATTTSNNADLTGSGTTAPSYGGTIQEVKFRIHQGASWSTYTTLNQPTGGWTWNALQNLDVTFYRTYDGLYYTMNSYVEYGGVQLGTMSSFDTGVIAKAEIEVTHSETTTGAYYIDAHSLLDNQYDAWTNPSYAFDGNTTTYAYMRAGGYDEQLTGTGSNAPSGTQTIIAVRGRLQVASSTWTDYVLLNEPTGGWSWSKIQGLNSITECQLPTPGDSQFVTQIYSDSDFLGSITYYQYSDLCELYQIDLEVISSNSGSGCSESTEANNNNCYPDITCTVDTGTCTGSTDASATYACTVNLQYFADPTDANTQYPDDTWLSTIKATDNNSTTGDAEVTQGVEMNSLMAFNITTEINYGNLGIGESNDPLDRITTITPTGNIGLDHEVSGPANMCTDFPTCSGGTIPIGHQKYALSASTSYDSSTSLTTSDVPVYTNVPKPTSGTPTTKNIWWGILVPDGTGPGTYDGNINIIGFKSDPLNW